MIYENKDFSNVNENLWKSEEETRKSIKRMNFYISDKF